MNRTDKWVIRYTFSQPKPELINQESVTGSRKSVRNRVWQKQWLMIEQKGLRGNVSSSDQGLILTQRSCVNSAELSHQRKHLDQSQNQEAKGIVCMSERMEKLFWSQEAGETNSEIHGTGDEPIGKQIDAHRTLCGSACDNVSHDVFLSTPLLSLHSQLRK